MNALSMDLRTRIIAAVEEGKENMREIAERFAVHYKTVRSSSTNGAIRKLSNLV